MSDEGEVPRHVGGFSARTPNAARMNDYYLGGKDNFAADREAAEKALAIAPEIREMALENQAFRARSVRYLIEAGVTQFVTVSGGLPTQRNIHEVARELDPDARVAYVDDDPVVLTHARALLATDPRTAVVKGDVMHPEEFLADPALQAVIDLERPVGVLIYGVLQYIPDEDDPYKSMARLRELLAPGSHLVIAHVVFDSRPDAAEPLVRIYQEVFGRTEDASRTKAEVARFFDGWELVEPGLTYIREWRPDSPNAYGRPDRAWVAVGVARKPA
ncbi:hypothetical protein HNP84_001308 [Thermocatellispora tengchongensis]|uniref:SAM-dependent methyltransferase n=1 Tax=Thermocatellispora tengchongensis TaxID=1073253 RepID=A0A840NWL4_9ACTN|nr:SAM-dependent methyltransferase [Thermocatellispora tengchongensis]MBB5131602.1 hypothetical protein [Thermocatellispora tengchongensis]